MKNGLFAISALLFLLFIMPNIQEIKASDNSIFIRADGSIDPPSPLISTIDNITYTLTGKICIGLTVERDNIVIDGKGYSVQGTYAGGTTGITISERSNITITNLCIDAFWFGIEVTYSSNIEIYFNKITYHFDGITLISTSNSTIYGNTIAENYDDSIWIENCTNIKIQKNSISGSTITDHDYGIVLFDSHSSQVEDNNITNTEYGIGLEYSKNNIITKNNIKKTNQCGIWLLYSANNTIYHNNFINNTYHASIFGDSYSNSWDNGLEGNYWDDYLGSDTNADGIGDTPYIIDSNNKDYNPLMSSHIVPESLPLFLLAIYLIATSLLVILRKRGRLGKCSQNYFVPK
jgi:parallel beta-helix repeat protein